MQVITSIDAMQSLRYPQGAQIGFVPTMGYLHEGHLSLVEASQEECSKTIVSIYVNPSQFGPNEDLTSYPRDTERDLALLESMGVNYVFMPTDAIMYPCGYKTWVEVLELSKILCGESRPEHFKGVCTIVLKLINLVRPNRMYMGEKDFQQLTILKKMLQDLNLPVEIIACPIVREQDGLAKSSRNVYLNSFQRQQALCLSLALSQAQDAVQSGEVDASIVIQKATDTLQNAGAMLDYIRVVDCETLTDQILITKHSRMLIAAYFGKTRLIDNALLKA